LFYARRLAFLALRRRCELSDVKASFKKSCTAAFLAPVLHSALAVMKDNSLLLHASPLLQWCERLRRADGQFCQKM
jgi:hypothetical protein